jgi:hypothetical protein
MLDWELRVTREKKKDCVWWGRRLEHLLAGPVDSLTLEHWFRDVAKSVARSEKLHYGIATMLGWTFTPEQRQVLGYLFWEIFGEQASRNRRNRALWRVQRAALKARGDE